ncbi:MAG: PAS domain S-box protein [Deltaproteobacteria bacterium]|nr:PAS domain S-box protein [Deltaproteobacteria bacterium]
MKRKLLILDLQLRIIRCYIQRLESEDEHVMNDRVKTKNVVMTDPQELGQRIGTVGVTESESKKAKEALNIVYDAFNSSVNGIIITDFQGEIHYVNPAFLRMFGYKESEILGKNAVTLLPSESMKKSADIRAIIDDNRGGDRDCVFQRHGSPPSHPLLLQRSQRLHSSSKWILTLP